MSKYVQAILDSYKALLKEEGMVSRDELLKMLKLDELIPEKYRTEKCYSEMADKIFGGILNKNRLSNMRMELYKQGLTAYEMAEKEGTTYNIIIYWHKTNGLPTNKKEPARTGN